MDTSKKPLINQNNSSNEHPKPKKKDANLKYNPTLYFLIGLAITLFSTYSLFELNFECSLAKLSRMDLYNCVFNDFGIKVSTISSLDRHSYFYSQNNE